MNKTATVAWYEFKKNVFTRGFIFVVLGIPLLLAISVSIGGFVANMNETNTRALGYVDEAGFLSDPIEAPLRAGQTEENTERVSIMAFDNRSAAEEAMEAGIIQAWYLFPETFLDDRIAYLDESEELSGNALSQFWDFVQINTLEDIPLEYAQRATAGYEVLTRSASGEIGEISQAIMNAMLPVIMAFMFYFLLIANAQTIAESVVKEKENRTIEVMITSTSPEKLIVGKIIGILGMCLVLAIAWTVTIIGIINIGGRVFDLEFLQNVQFSMQNLFVVLMVLVPAFILATVIMVGFSVTFVEVQEAQNIGMLIAVSYFSPYFFIGTLINDPNSLLAQVLTYFPVTAPFTIALRSAVTAIPWWQLTIVVTTLWVMVLGMMYVTGKIFHHGLLRYGKRMKINEIIQRVFGKEEGVRP